MAMLMIASHGLASAAEIRLRRECLPSGTLVTLADVAEIHAVDTSEAEQLGAVQLFPAPVPGKNRYLPCRELQDLLRLKGVNLTGHVIAGASQTVIHATFEEPSEVAVATPAVRPLARHDRDRAIDRIADEIVNYLNIQGGAAAWQVEIKAIHSDLRPLVELAGDSTLVVLGGKQPWTGTQAFTVQFETETGPVALPVVVEVSLPTMVLAASRTLQRGAIVQASDLQFQARRANDENIVALEAPEDAVGRQVTRSIPAGAVLAVSDLREPIVVRRGDAVTVYSRAPGVRVRTTARAKQDGGLGDLIEVESFNDRSKFFARVSGIQEVEIFARGATLAPPMAVVPASTPTTAPAEAVREEGQQVTPITVTAKAKPVVWRRATESRQRPVGE